MLKTVIVVSNMGDWSFDSIGLESVCMTQDDPTTFINNYIHNDSEIVSDISDIIEEREMNCFYEIEPTHWVTFDDEVYGFLFK